MSPHHTPTPMRRVLPLILALGFVAGCSSTRYDRYDRSGRSYPASARVYTEGGQARYVLCHKGKTMTLPSSAVDGHRRHGDTFGSCRRADRRADRRDDRRADRRSEARGNGNGKGKGKNKRKNKRNG